MQSGMEYLVLWILIIGAVAFFFVRGVLAEKKKRRWLTEQLRSNFGQLPDKEWKPECYDNLECYHLYHSASEEQEAVHVIDDITWNDLEMDRLFFRMDYTMSRAGAEYLYHTLRTQQLEEEKLVGMEEQIVWFMEHGEERVRLQLLLKRLGSMEKYSLYQYLEQLHNLGERSNAKHILGNLFYLIAGFVFTIDASLGLIAIMLTAGVNIGIYLQEKRKIEPYITSLAYILGLIHVSKGVMETEWPVIRKEREQLLAARQKLKKFARGSFLVTGGRSASGNPAEVVVDYICMLFHIDLILFNKMYQEVMLHHDEIDRMFGIWGYLDTIISIGAFRASLPKWCTPVFKQDTGWNMTNGYHPLLTKPVKNSINAEKGVLITGSNASGKSTFLKTAALNTLLAQSIHTVAADSLIMQRVRLYSSMALRDDMEAGESYYIVEIKSIKRILDAVRTAEAEEIPVLSFVDEVLRGTNTIERIAASTQVLKGLNTEHAQCFAATHDIELCSLLGQDYDNYHFEEEIRDGDVLFSYQLKAGRTLTRNAIRLLQVMGYEQEIVSKAQHQAEYFLKTGQWREEAEG